MAMYGTPAGLLGLMGAGAGGGGGFLGAFNGGMNAFGQAEQAQAGRADRQMQGMLQMAQMEHKIRAAEQQQAERQKAQMQALAQQGQAEELRGQIPANLQELFDVDQKTAIARAFPEAQKPGDRFRTVGNQLFDISGDAPKLAATAPRDEGLRQVFDPKTGQARYVRESEAIGQMPPPKQGITIGPDGTVQIGGQATPLGKKAQGEIETNLMNAGAGLERLDLISQSYNPEYTTFQGAAKAKAYRTAEKAGVPLGDDKKEFLRGFATWRANTGSNIALYIKEISGAAASDTERAFLQQNVPSADDSDTEFQAKYASTIKALRSVKARLSYIRNKGLDAGDDFAGISLSSMPKLMSQRGQQLEAQATAANPDAPIEQIRAMVKVQLKQEFGI